MNSSLILMILIATQIIAESFPISSSGHLHLVGRLAQFFGFEHVPQLPEYFDHFLHGPTIIVLIIYFWRSWAVPMRLLLCGWWRCITTGHGSDSWRRLRRLFFKILGLVCAADGITALFYFVIKKRLHDVVWLQSDAMLLVGFVVTMGLLLSLPFVSLHSALRASIPPTPRWLWRTGGTNGKDDSDGSSGSTNFYEKFIRWLGEIFSYRSSRWSPKGEWRDANAFSLPAGLMLGLAQSIALILPGISRFASTYVVARWLGIEHRRAFQISFLVLFPLIIAGFLVNGVPGMVASGMIFEIMTIPMFITFGGSTVVSFFALKLADWMGARQKMWWFGVYMLVPEMVMIIFLILNY